VKRKSLKKLSEETQGTIDQGIIRTVPLMPPPPPGEGWPVNPGDPGPLVGYTDNVNPWMQGATEADGVPIHVESEESEDGSSVTEEEEEEESGNPFAKKKKKKKGKKGEKEEEGEEVDEATRDEVMTSFAAQVVELPESEENSPFRALAAAFLLERDERINESEAYSRVVGKIQEKLAEAEQTGKLVVESTDELLEQKYNVSLHIIEELKNRLKLLSAKVYAEQQLDSIGRKGDKAARQIMAEAIKKDASKSSIDEAFIAIKGMKALGVVNNINPNKKSITESVQRVEAAVNSLTESNSGRGMSVSDMVSRLSRNMTSARSL
ncbi:MAG: hypothetical protein WCJ49_04745, partial [Deltaproteobacteria bacterium]